MDAASLLTRLTEVIDAHAWDALPLLLHPDFTCRLVHTGEVFDRDVWVRLNADYPGFQRMLLSFATLRDGLLAELTEVWADVGQPAPEGTRALA